MAKRKPKNLTAGKEILSDEAKMQLIRIAFISALSFERIPDLDDWSDQHRVLPQSASSEPGKWRTQRFPFLRRIMKKLSPSSIARHIVVSKGSQLGFTEIFLCWILYNAACNPGGMAYIQKTEDAVAAFSKEKLAPSILACKAVENTLGDKRSSRYTSSLTSKTYPGGFLSLGPANSTSFLKSKSLRDGAIDEEDEFELNVGKQGSPRKLLERRMTNFPNRKLGRISTPVLKELSTIEPGYLEGTQEQYYVPCPNCNPDADEDGYMFLLEWETIKYCDEINPVTGDPVRVWCECPSCGHEIEEAKHKTWMLDNGDWYSTKNVNDPDNPLPRYKTGDVEYHSFRITSFYSPLGFYSWANAVHDWFEYKRSRDIHLLQVFVNQVCAETFTLTGRDIDYTGLVARKVDYGSNVSVPHGGLCLTAGVDIQDDRIEVEVVAWGIMDESWSVDYTVLVGDTALMGDRYGMLSDGRPSVWRLLDEHLRRKYRHATGAMMPIEVTMVDTGFRPDEVHKFCRPREANRVYPVKGRAGWGMGLWKRATRRHEKYKTIDYVAYVDELKTKTYALLQVDLPGPGYCHFPNLPQYTEQHFKQLTCEHREVRMISGQHVLRWVKPDGARNEQIDCRNYAYVARSCYSINMEQRNNMGIDRIFGDHAPRRVAVKRKGSKGL